MSTDARCTGKLPAINNNQLEGKSSIDTIPISKLPAVGNNELADKSCVVTIPSTDPTVAGHQQLIDPLHRGTIPSTDPAAVDNTEPARELSIDKIPTLKLPAVNNKKLEEELSIDKIPTLKLSIVGRKHKLRRHKLRRRNRKQPALLITGIVTMLLFSVIVSTYLLTSGNVLLQAIRQQTRSRLNHPTPTVPITPTVTSTHNTEEITALGQQYMNALLNQQYSIMWSLLHPQLQAMWPDEISFINYCKMRFQGFTLQQFTLGQVYTLSSWVNPETMIHYNQVKVLPISLQLSPQVSADKLSLLPTPDQNPSQLFQNLPLITQRTTIRTGKETVDQWLILSGGPVDLEAPILPPITPIRKTLKIPILMYHHISNIPTRNTLDRSLTVTPDIFAQQLDYLKQHGYHTITFNQLFDALYYNGPLPTKPIILTFDDGHDDAYRFAYPLLKEYGYSGMFYIITGKVGWKGQATWDQLREMLANGMQMGSHTITHRNLGEVWRYSQDKAQQELEQSRQDMQAQLGIVIQQFCYPAGEPFHHEKPVVQQAVMSLLEKNGYVGATTAPPPVGMLQDSQKPFILLRTRVDGRATLQEFVKSIS